MPAKRPDVWVDPAPFCAWLASRVAAAEELADALADIGWVGDAAERRWRRWSSGEQQNVRLSDVEDALAAAGSGLWELDGYAEHVEQLSDEPRFCPACADEVYPALARPGECPVCLGALPRVVAVGHGRAPRPRGPRRNRSRAQVRRHLPANVARLPADPRPDADATLGAVVERVPKRGPILDAHVRVACEALVRGGLSLPYAARALLAAYPGRWRSEADITKRLTDELDTRGLLAVRGQKRRSITAAQIRIERERIAAFLATTPEPPPTMAYRGPLGEARIWEAAWLYYYDGLGFQRMARLMLAREPGLAASEKAMTTRLHDAFRTNGWPRRDRIEATRAASYKHGLKARGRDDVEYRRAQVRAHKPPRPRCKAVTAKGGERCKNFAMSGSSRCLQHDEKRAADRRRALERAWAGAAADLVPAGPYVLWLRARREEHGTQRALAALLSLSDTMLGRQLRAEQLTRRVIERSLAAYRTAVPDALVPRFVDLYDIAPAAAPSTQLPAARAA